MQRELGSLRLAKLRFEQPVCQLCDQYNEIAREKSQVEQEKSNARDALEGHTAELLQIYQTEINQYLEKFGADFRVNETEDQFSGGKPSLGYCITVRDENVPLDNSNSAEPAPCFKTCLSSGDRSALAAAFFLARLDQTDLTDAVLIFDDPISSLDCHRMTCTAQQIMRMADLAEQVIVLSHDPYFLRLIWEDSRERGIKTLCIKRKGESSRLEEWDIEKETQTEYFRNWFPLAEYVEKGSEDRELESIARCIRPLLEGNLRMRFPGEFNRQMWLGEMLKHMQDLLQRGVLPEKSRETLRELEEIKDYAKRFHHDRDPDASTYRTTDAELKPYVERTLRILRSL